MVLQALRELPVHPEVQVLQDLQVSQDHKEPQAEPDLVVYLEQPVRLEAVEQQEILVNWVLLETLVQLEHQDSQGQLVQQGPLVKADPQALRGP